MATRARILADYVSSGDELALKAPLASPAFTGSPSITLGSDATGDVYYRAAGGALTRLATGADGTVLTSTGAGAVPAFEAIPASGSSAGSSAFLMGMSGAWDTVASGSVVGFAVTSGYGFNVGSDFNTTSFAYETPAAGVYIFGFHMYSNTSSNASTWTFAIDGTDLALVGGVTRFTHGTDTQIVESTVVLNLASGAEVDVRSEAANSAFYKTLSYYWGCRLS